jgi:hypothetical protein
MKRSLFLLGFLVFIHAVGLAQGAPPITFREIDGSPRKTAPTVIQVSNGTLTCVGSVCTITTGGGGGSGLADPGANGVVVRTSAGVTVARTLAGTANRIVITNGTGVSGNPTFDIGSDVVTLTGTQSLTNKTLSVPTVADFTNAAHAHTNAAGGGQLNASNIFSAGTVPVARLPIMVGDAGAGGTAGLVPAPVTGDATKFLRGDATWQTVSGGGGSPGGSDTQLQYNNASAFGGVSGATSDGTNVTFGSANLRATSPRLTTGILDSAGNPLFNFTATGSAVNSVSFANAAAGTSPAWTATGSDTDIGHWFTPKGAGSFRVYDSANTTNYFQFVQQLVAPGVPRTQVQGGDSSADSNWAIRFSHAYSSSGTPLTTGLQVSTNNDPGYTGADTILFYATTAGHVLASVNGPGDDGKTFTITTEATTTPTSSPNLFLDTSANGRTVGIRTNTPAAQLHVVSSAAGTVGLRVDTAASPSAAIANFTENGTARVTVQNNGQVLLSGIALANLGTPADGTITYCTSCNVNTDPCTGGGTGAIAMRLAGRWYCP